MEKTIPAFCAVLSAPGQAVLCKEKDSVGFNLYFKKPQIYIYQIHTFIYLINLKAINFQLFPNVYVCLSLKVPKLLTFLWRGFIHCFSRSLILFTSRMPMRSSLFGAQVQTLLKT
jgi:hypothetical protein